jgi:hypothetical protein
MINNNKKQNNHHDFSPRANYTDRATPRLLAKLMPTFAVCMMDPYDSILDFLDQSRHFFFQVAPQLYSRG